jgi:hypothetical protein
MAAPPSGARLPDFLIIGAPKCGTSWMARTLSDHPGVCMPKDEIQFFTDEWDKGWDWYLKLFEAARPGQLLGENSNTYLTDPAALPRILAAVPDVKLICSLRHPVERAYSSYGMQVDRGRANGDIERYMDPGRSPRPHILTNGLYARMLKPYFDAFGPDRILVTLFDELRADPGALYGRVTGWLGVDPSFAPVNLVESENARKQHDVPGGIKRALWWLRPALSKGSLSWLGRGPIGQVARKAMARPKRYPPLTPEIAGRLNDYYAQSLDELERLLGRPLGDWKGRYAEPLQSGRDVAA